MGVEPTDDGVTRRPPVLKTGTITGPHALPLRATVYPKETLIKCSAVLPDLCVLCG
jgi:hypothetical protein